MAIPNSSIFNIEVTVKGTTSAGGSNATKAENVFHFLRPTTIFGINKGNINTAFQASILDAMADALNTRWSANRVEIRILDDPLDPATSFTAAQVGLVLTDSQPSRNAVYMELISGFRGRSYNGSKHFSPISEADTTKDVLTGAGLTNFQALRDAIELGFTDADGNVWLPSVYSRTLSSPTVLPVATIVNTQVVEVRLTLTIGQMKRRKAASTH